MVLAVTGALMLNQLTMRAQSSCVPMRRIYALLVPPGYRPYLRCRGGEHLHASRSTLLSVVSLRDLCLRTLVILSPSPGLAPGWKTELEKGVLRRLALRLPRREYFVSVVEDVRFPTSPP